MILQSLVDLYERRAAAGDPQSQPAPTGFERKPIQFILEIDQEGNLIQIADNRIPEGKRLAGRKELVPQAVKRASGVAADLLWGTMEYVIGYAVQREDRSPDPQRVASQHEAFRRRIDSLSEYGRADRGVSAVARFLDRLEIDRLAALPIWPELIATNPTVAFRLGGDPELVCQRPAVRRAWLEQLSSRPSDGICLVTGESVAIERLHPAIKGVWGAQTSGANIVSFNLDAFSSFGKEQGGNAPVGDSAAARYTTALNDLLAHGSRQRVQVGDATTVFWADHANSFTDDFLLLIGEPARDDPARDTARVKALYESICRGRYLDDVRGEDRFFVLGLAPNAARLSVRFWHVETVATLVSRFRRWFEDTRIEHGPEQPDNLSLFRLLTAVALQGKAENVPPNLGEAIMRAILGGTRYPISWLQAAVRRCRAERSITHPRAAAIKACLNRQAADDKEMFTVSLDPTNASAAYRLGRLFAVLERIQEEASPGLNSTIRERYYGAASSNPRVVFPTLTRLKNHHLAKLENRGRSKNLERLIGDIMDGLPAGEPFPAFLSLADQGRFAVGYYHQRQHSSTYRATPDSETQE